MGRRPLRTRRAQRRPDRLRREGSAEPVRLPEPAEREAYLVLDFALRAGEVLLSGGAGAADVTATTMALTAACGLRHVDCDITFTSITLVYFRTPDVAPVTSMRVVRRRALDYTRVTEVHNLVADLVEGRTDPAAARARLQRVRAAQQPYRGWVVTPARAVLAASVAVLLGAGPAVTAVALVATAVVDRVLTWLDARHVPLFYQNVVGGLIATSTAVALVAADAGVRPGLVVASGIILLLPGTALVGAVQDAITGFLVTAAARALEVMLLTAGLVAGVGIALDLGVRFGVVVAISSSAPFALSQVPVQLLAAGTAAGAFAVANYAPRRTVPAAALAGALGWAALLGGRQLDLDPAVASALAAVVVGLGSYAIGRRQKAPPLVYLAAGIIPLLPGLTIYRGMLQLAQGDTVGGLVTLGNAIAIGLALAAGAILGGFIAQPSRRDVARFEQRLVGPRLAGPPRGGRGDRPPADEPAPPPPPDGGAPTG